MDSSYYPTRTLLPAQPVGWQDRRARIREGLQALGHADQPGLTRNSPESSRRNAAGATPLQSRARQGSKSPYAPHSPQ